MKQIFIMALLGIGAVACGNAKQANEGVASEAAVAADNKTEVVAAETNTEEFVLADNGVGPIVLGMSVADIPSSVTGLYDRVEKTETPDAEEYQFFSGETALFSAEDWGDGKVSAISLWNESPVKVATTSGEGYISL